MMVSALATPRQGKPGPERGPRPPSSGHERPGLAAVSLVTQCPKKPGTQPIAPFPQKLPSAHGVAIQHTCRLLSSKLQPLNRPAFYCSFLCLDGCFGRGAGAASRAGEFPHSQLHCRTRARDGVTEMCLAAGLARLLSDFRFAGFGGQEKRARNDEAIPPGTSDLTWRSVNSGTGCF